MDTTVIALALAAHLAGQQSAGRVPPVPHTMSAVMLDARCDDEEWRNASLTPIAGGSVLQLQQDATFVYLCVTLPPDSYGTMDLYVQPASTEMPTNLHASAQVGDRQRTAAGWPDWTFGNQRDWYSPPVALSRAEVADNRPRLTFGAVQAREVAIRKSKFGQGPWRILLEIRALGAAKTGTLLFPESGRADDPSTWAPLPFAAPAGAPAGATSISIDSRALGETREIWVDTPRDCDSTRCEVLLVLDAHALFPLAASYRSVMRTMGRMRPIVVVGIPSRSTDDRIRNFTSSVAADDRARYPQAGGAAKFSEFLTTEVMPAVTSRFAVRGAWVLAGHSLGGLLAVQALSGDRFNTAIAISPTLGWNAGAAITEFEQWIKSASSPSPKRLYVSVADGDTDIYRAAFDRLQHLVSTAQRSWLQSTFARRTQEDHVSTVAPALQQAMLQFFAP